MLRYMINKTCTELVCWKLYILYKEIKDNLHKWWDIPRWWIGRLKITKTSTVSKMIYNFNAIPTKFHQHFLDTDKLIKTFMWKGTNSGIAKTMLTKKKKFGRIILGDTKSMWQNRNPGVDQSKYSQLIFDKDAKVIQWRKNSLFNKWWNNWISLG